METIDAQQLHLSSEQKKSLEEGHTLALMEAGGLLAFVIPAFSPNSKRPFGLAKGEFTVPDDFNDPLPEIEAAFLGENSPENPPSA